MRQPAPPVSFIHGDTHTPLLPPSLQVQSYEKALASVKGDLLRAKEKEDKDALLGGSGVRRGALIVR